VRLYVARNVLQRFLRNHKGTAEVIGTLMAVVILIFFFSSVYLWHDQATKEMNSLLSDKMNSPVTINWKSDNKLLVNDTGGVAASLSRLWLTNSQRHSYLDLEHDPALPGTPVSVVVKPGNHVEIQLVVDSGVIKSIVIDHSMVYPIDDFPIADATFKIVTTLGNMASCSSS
jgi:hypothetical protein